MSTMAKCLRLALSASNKLVQSHCNLQIAQNSLLRLNKCQAAFHRQLSAAVVSPYLRQNAPTLAAVKTCTCAPRRLLQTEVDKELSKFLDKEIDYEEKQADKSTNVKGIEGFEVSTDDADVTLTRKAGSETIVVKFNINSTVDSEGPLQASEQEPEAEMVSRHPSQWKCVKERVGTHCPCSACLCHRKKWNNRVDHRMRMPSWTALRFRKCHYTKGEWKDTVYSVSADIMDGNLYDLLMDMLDERGINEEFANQLVDFSTSYEHKRYLSFLKDLKSFVEK